MRVLHLIKNFDFGGAENHVRDLANSLDELGHDVFIVGGKGRQICLLNKGVHFISLRLKDVLIPFQVFYISYISLKNKVQVIHAHQRLPILTACIVGKITGIPIVVTVHGRTRYDLRSRISRKYSHKIIFVSQYVLEVSARLEEIKHKSVIIPNWVSVSARKSEKQQYSISYISRLDKKHSELILLMIQKVIFPLVSEFPGITFKIIGDGDFLPEIREEAMRLNRALNKEVCVVCGFIPEVKEVIRQSEMIMGVGRVALEAMACGVPVLSINQRRLGTFISTNNYSFYKKNNFIAVENQPPDEKSLFELLNNFFIDSRCWQKESLTLQEYVNEDFNPLKILLAIFMLYDETFESVRKGETPYNYPN
jgi:Glycosyltransferase